MPLGKVVYCDQPLAYDCISFTLPAEDMQRVPSCHILCPTSSDHALPCLSPLQIADESKAVLSFPEARLGIIPGAGGTQRLPRLVGPSTARELVFTARRVGGPEAANMGLVNHTVPEGSAYARALDMARDVVLVGG